MSAETQLNAFKEELKQAVKDAHAALDKAVEQFDSYLTKFEAENASVAEPETPVEPPAAQESTPNKKEETPAKKTPEIPAISPVPGTTVTPETTDIAK